MSSYKKMTKHPYTGKFEEAEWLDGYYGKHDYGVKFPSDNKVFPADKFTWEFPSDSLTLRPWVQEDIDKAIECLKNAGFKIIKEF